MSVLDKVRRWIDGESAELVLEEAARDAQIKPRSEAEEFIVKIAKAIESVMQKEMLPLPQGTAIIPSEYTVFLSEVDDKEWQGVKRRGLEQGLYHILAERAKEIAGKNKLQTRSFVIDLRVDGTLDKGSVNILHSWEESSSNKTGVLARPKNDSSNSEMSSHQNAVEAPYEPPSLQQPPVFQPIRNPISSAPVSQYQQPNSNSAEFEELTNVKKRVTEIYRLEIWLNGVRQNIIPIFNKEVSIGRGSKSRPVDIALQGDPEISRKHLTLYTDGNGSFWAVNEGKNPSSIGQYELPMGQKVPLQPGASLIICSYIVRIQPRTN